MLKNKRVYTNNCFWQIKKKRNQTDNNTFFLTTNLKTSSLYSQSDRKGRQHCIIKTSVIKTLHKWSGNNKSGHRPTNFLTDGTRAAAERFPPRRRGGGRCRGGGAFAPCPCRPPGQWRRGAACPDPAQSRLNRDPWHTSASRGLSPCDGNRHHHARSASLRRGRRPGALPSESPWPPASGARLPQQLAGRRAAAVDAREPGRVHAERLLGHGQGPERGVRRLRRQVLGEALRPVHLRGYVLCGKWKWTSECVLRHGVLPT